MFLKNLVVSGSLLHEFEMCYGFSQKNILHKLKKWRDDPEITKKLFFCFIFGLKICLVQTYVTKVFRLAYWYRVSSAMYLERTFSSSTVKLFLKKYFIILLIYNIIYNFGKFVFYWMFYLLSLSYINFVCVILLKHNGC